MGSTSLPPKSGGHFFKVISAQSARSDRLRIPVAFMSQYGDTVPNKVFLQVPSGVVWPAELRKSSGSVWLQNGRQEFRDYYKIGFGHFLVLRYDGKSHFHVLLFDRNTLEIEYPSSASQRVGTGFAGKSQIKTEDVEMDDSVKILEEFLAGSACQTVNDSVEILGDHPPCERNREKSPPPVRRFTRKGKPITTGKSETTSNNFLFGWKSSLILGMTLCVSTSFSDEPKRCQCSEVSTGRERMASNSRNIKALHSVKAFKSRNPFFMVVMQPTYVARPYLIFAKEYFKKHHKEVTLKVSDGRTWSLPCAIFKNSVRINGWATFAADNSLGVGEGCVFQLINAVKIVLKVVIFRAAE